MAPRSGDAQREPLLWALSAATFLIFFQAFMVAPLLPRLSDLFGVSIETMGLVVPAYLIPYGVATLNKGQAMGLNVFTLFTGFGTGSLLFAVVMRFGLDVALVVFGAAPLLAALGAGPLFGSETARAAPAPATGAAKPRQAAPSRAPGDR